MSGTEKGRGRRGERGEEEGDEEEEAEGEKDWSRGGA